ncbi:hypothetical protein AAON49_06025 [Pseudotenacibaculum sp. MALMAid0570]|uniref:hypothetical protein n=1 Tax=Pseudotenacibaculum sp. MALMAid0570 TaxID=3143938 RepID=UPI0032DE508B
MNNNKLTKVLTIVAVVIALIGAFFYIRILSAGDEAIESTADLQNSIISPFVWVTIIVLGIAVAASLISSISSLIKKPEQLKKTLLSIGALAVVLVISYFLHDASEVVDASGKVLDGGAQGETSNVWSSTGIWFSVILGAVGLGMFLVDMVKSLVKS